MTNYNQFYPRNVIENVIHNVDSLISATSIKTILEHNQNIAKILHYENGCGLKNFNKLKNILNVKSLNKWNRVSSILKKLAQKADQKEYSGKNRIPGKCILVIGGGISGLRVAIELLLLGAKVICVEKRDEFSRNNVIHLWPNVINDMYTFEAKRLYGQFCVGSIDHISIRQLQLILLKIALIYGLVFVPNVAFDEICPRIIEPTEFKCTSNNCNCCCHIHGFGGGAYAHFSSSNKLSASELSKQPFDVIIGCDGRRSTFSRYFPRNNRRGKLAIGLTANYVNKRTEDEARCQEISGTSRIYNQKWFKDLQDETNIELENLVYYRDETHYFVMTATKASLLRRGVLKSDYGDSHQLLHLNNIDASKLMKYSKDAAEWSSKLQNLEFALNSSNMPDVALFDFTSMYSATNASCAKKIYLKCCDNHVQLEQNTKYTLMLLCGDSLLEPFWPTGSGAGRGFLSALDAAWTVSQWYCQVTDEVDSIDAMLNVISRREYIYRLLAQTSPDNTTNKNFTLNPQTRYKNLNLRDSKKLHELKYQVRHLIIDKKDLDKSYVQSYESKRSRRATVGIDPEDVLKAKSLSQKPLSLYDDSNKILPAFSNNSLYSVPSERSIYNCDSLKVIQLKPRNFDNEHVDFQPRNCNSEFNKKNHQARNHFFLNEGDNLEANSEFEQFNNKRRPMSKSLYIDSNSNGDANVNSDYKDFFFNDFEFKQNGHREGFSKKTSNLSERRELIEKTCRPALNSFENKISDKPKKSIDILEKAQYLEQKFEEQNKPYSPKLTKVGKIEDEDWNVRIWNSADVFAPKTKEKKNMVNDNSKELLQSRIKQLNNNFTNKKEIVKPKSKVTNEFVNYLSNEVCQKLSQDSKLKSINKKADLLVSSEVPKVEKAVVTNSTDDGVDSSQPSTSSEQTSRPTVECKRCSKSVLSFDKFVVKGNPYHKSCLTCKECSVLLRHDEFENDDFVCKICLRSRTNITSSFRNAFFSFSNEAKKNFLINVEQIDLRERAEFELLDNVNSVEHLPVVDNDNLNSSDVQIETKEEVQAINGEGTSKELVKNEDAHTPESELSSDVDFSEKVSDENYTDDEFSENDDIEDHKDITELSLKDHNSKAQNSTESNSCNQSTNNLKAEPIETSTNTNYDRFALKFNFIASNKNNANQSSNEDADMAVNSLDFISNTHFNGQNADYHPPSDSSLLFHNKQVNKTDVDTVIHRAFGGQDSVTEANMTRSAISTISNSQKTKPSVSLPFRYSGQFTEKFYRTLSQPTLAEQMNLIEKLKKHSKLTRDLPFADSHEEATMKPVYSSSTKLSHAPVARIEDV